MRLLLVEDDTLIADSLNRQLTAAGFTVDQAQTARQAEQLGKQEDYRAVVLDLGLPDGNGLNVLKNWRADKLTMPVLILACAAGFALFSLRAEKNGLLR